MLISWHNRRANESLAGMGVIPAQSEEPSWKPRLGAEDGEQTNGEAFLCDLPDGAHIMDVGQSRPPFLPTLKEYADFV